mmetsp:Transcript_57557/g.148046  ORF Transcript_57557/g.148046 Transcript_57557/m.148046 type:complete len:246 (+) Transcript_57557:471-1208(+)
MHLSKRRRTPSSRSHGAFDVANTSRCPLSVFVSLRSPSIWMRNSVLKRREASCSFVPPRWESMESNSSKKRTAGTLARAAWKSSLRRFSDSPCHFEASVAELQLKKVRCSVHEATALAIMVLPQPGGPNKSTPFQGLRRPVKNSGMISGSKTASLTARLASSRPLMSSKRTFMSLQRRSLSIIAAMSLASDAARLWPTATPMEVPAPLASGPADFVIVAWLGCGCFPLSSVALRDSYCEMRKRLR